MTVNRDDFQHVEDLIAVVYPDRLTAADVVPRWTPPLPAGPVALEGAAVFCGRIIATTGLPCFLAAGHPDGHRSRQRRAERGFVQNRGVGDSLGVMGEMTVSQARGRLAEVIDGARGPACATGVARRA